MSSNPSSSSRGKGGGGGGGKPKYGQNTGYTSQRPIGGPGIWITCVRGMEKRALPEVLGLLDEVADRLYPADRLAALELLRPVKIPYVAPPTEGSNQVEGDDAMETDTIDAMETETAEVPEVVEEEEEEEEDIDESIEASIARELAELKAARPPRKEWNNKGRDGKDSSGPKQPKVKKIRPRFENLDVKTECVLFISCAFPYNPTEITETIVSELQATGRLRTKYTNRFSPVMLSCSSLSLDPVRIISIKLIEEVFTQFAIDNNKSHITYQIDPTVRLHTGPFSRSVLIELLGSIVRSLALPPSPTAPFPDRPSISTSADLTTPDLVILPTVQRNLYGLSVVRGNLWSGTMGRKFNLDAIAKEFRDRKLVADEASGEILSRVGAVLEAKREDGSMEVDIAMRSR